MSNLLVSKLSQIFVFAFPKTYIFVESYSSKLTFHQQIITDKNSDIEQFEN